MRKRLFHLATTNGGEITLSVDDQGQLELKLDRPGVAAVSAPVSIDVLNELADAAYRADQPPPEKAFGGTDPGDA